jgi:hypothetical protein
MAVEMIFPSAACLPFAGRAADVSIDATSGTLPPHPSIE